MRMIFQDRAEAGRRLACELSAYANTPGVVVLALPRGGVPIGFEVACALDAPLDVLVVRKVGVPSNKELAMGAVAREGVVVLDQMLIERLALPPEVVERAVKQAEQELDRREAVYRDHHARADVQGRTVIVVDDGMATGSSMLAALKLLRKMGPARLVVAIPVSSATAFDLIRAEADQLVCLEEIEPFYSVGEWYQDFPQINDAEVASLLERASDLREPASTAKSRR
jgi:putative phosphoribosyl transferase